jgi:hypothetical protein
MASKNTSDQDFVQRLLVGVLAVTLAVVSVWLLGIFPISIAFSVFLLCGIWAVDALIKCNFGFDSETLFADLSLEAVVLLGIRGMPSLAMTFGGAGMGAEGQMIAVYLFWLGILWLVNLSVCRSLQDSELASGKRSLAWVMSLIIAIASAYLSLHPQLIGLI